MELFSRRRQGLPFCERQNKVLYGFGIGGSLLAGLHFSLSSLLSTVGLGFSLMGFMSAEDFLFHSMYSDLGFFL